MRINVIDDDEYNLIAYREELLAVFLEARVLTFTTLFDAIHDTCDVLVIDLSAIAPIIRGPHDCYAPICKYLELMPGCIVFISSAVTSSYAESVAEDVLERIPDATIVIVPYTLNRYRDLAATVKKKFPT